MKMQIRINQVQGQVRRETLAGRDYLVAPVVAIRAGVLNNALAPLEEIGRFVDAWNGIPVPLGHPKVNGLPVSANSPELEAQAVVGRFWRAELVDDRLVGEIWIDVEKARALGGDALTVLERLEKGEGIEVSTAYFCDLEEKPGTFNGQRFFGIQRNLRPDHLALLLHQIGACSWKDGCGVPRLNELQTNEQHTGVMIALYPSAEAAAQLALSGEGGLPEDATITPAGEIHLTLAYLGDSAELKPEYHGSLLQRVMEWAKMTPIVRGNVSGIGRFTTPTTDGMQAVFLLYDCGYLEHLRWWLTDGLPVSTPNRGFIPHITLAYVPADAPTPGLAPAPQELVFDRVGVAWGGQVTLFDLQGEAAIASNEAGEETGMQTKNGFNPVSLARKALQGLARALGWTETLTEETPAVNDAPGAGEQSEEVAMDREGLIAKLVGNANCPFDQAELQAMPDSALTKLEQKLEHGCGTPAANEATVEAAPVTNEPATAVAAVELTVPAELQEVTNLLRELGGVQGVKAALETIQANANLRKGELTAELKANERCAFSEEDLQAMRVDQLEKLASSLKPADYGGRGGPRGNARTEVHQVPEPPKILLAEPDTD